MWHNREVIEHGQVETSQYCSQQSSGGICITPELKRQGFGKKLLDYSLDNTPPQGYFVNEDEVEEFDKGFSYKEKLKLPGQLF